MKTKKKLILSRKCNWCNRELILNGKDSDSYVINAEYKYFCIIQDPGKPAERDCMKNYLEDKNEYPIKKKLEEKKEKKIAAIPRVLAKAEALKNEKTI